MAIRFFDMFAGIGGFRSGLEAIGGFECVGYCEIDKYAKQAYEAMYDTGGTLFFRLLELLPLKNLSISSSKMFPVCLTMTQAKHLKQSSVRGPRKAVSFLGRGGTA